tara:strand:- start:611 stop:925 length:315 start_codon:yes stop_codon:yes gene_type:complete
MRLDSFVIATKKLETTSLTEGVIDVYEDVPGQHTTPGFACATLRDDKSISEDHPNSDGNYHLYLTKVATYQGAKLSFYGQLSAKPSHDNKAVAADFIMVAETAI